MSEAAKPTDVTAHGPPLYPGPGSPDVSIRPLPAWRALLGRMGAGIEAAAKAMKGLMGADGWPKIFDPGGRFVLAA